MFRTTVKIEPSALKISHEDKILTLGSCFSENIGDKLQKAFFETDINPFGVLFNPSSIKNSLNMLAEHKVFTEQDIFKHGSLWNSFSHSTLFSTQHVEDTLQQINSRLSIASGNLSKTKFLLITFGTSWVYEYKDTTAVVANCHKLPANQFTRRRLSVEEIVCDYIALFHKLKTEYPDLQVIFSISPIRHWKDGAHENNLSKSILHLSVEKLQKLFSWVNYFPAYEILLDELRDYRFFASDMFHPSELAVDYIWQRFSETYFSTKTNQLKVRLEKLSTQMAHRPIHPDSIEFSYFSYQVEQQKAELRKEFPFLERRF